MINITTGLSVGGVDVAIDADSVLSSSNIEFTSTFHSDAPNGSLIIVTEYKAIDDIFVERISLVNGAITTIAKVNAGYR